jgi:hypothetical protein
MVSIYAGATVNLWATTRDEIEPGAEYECSACQHVDIKPPRTVARTVFEENTKDDSPVFTIAQLDFWQAQQVLDQTVPAVERIKLALKMGLVSIDGDKAAAQKFIASPAAKLVNPLFDAIVSLAAGN